MEVIMTHSIGKTIAKLRKGKKWTQIELAEKLQVSDKAISKWEQDNGTPSIEFFPALAEVFNVSIDYLMTGKKLESEMISMPKDELCAKADSSLLLSDINVIAKDENGKISRVNELAIQSALHCGVLCIDEILATKDYKLIKKAIETYPVTTYELQGAVIESAMEYLSNNNWRDLFEYAVDKGDKKLITFVLARDAVSCGKILNYRLEQIGNITYPEGAKSNASHMKLRERASFGSDYKGRLTFIAACKKQILDDCALKLDMDRVTDDLDEAYFKNELAKGNFEIIIIKLCVRLEAILRGKYHYDGDFSEMLNQYCSKFGSEDDGWGYDVEAGFVRYLHKLRKCRNSIVHAEKTNDTMSIDELKFCIDYICKMG